jgi:glycosyltransferase involved in cell wall biosynthesis
MKNFSTNQPLSRLHRNLLKSIRQKYKKTSNPISILFVVHNEEEVIEETIQSFFHEIDNKVPPKIIVAEDGSADDTKKILLNLRKTISMTLVTGKNKKGYMRATKDGLMQVNSDIIFITDSDGQFVPSDFWKLYEELENYDVIIGWKKNRADPPWRKIIAKSYHLLVRIVFRLPIHDPNTAFRIIRKKVLDDITHETQYLKYSFWTEFTVRAFNKGYRVTEIPINHKKRLNGKSHIYSLNKFPQMLITQITGLFKLWRELKTRN